MSCAGGRGGVVDALRSACHDDSGRGVWLSGLMTHLAERAK